MPDAIIDALGTVCSPFDAEPRPDPFGEAARTSGRELRKEQERRSEQTLFAREAPDEPGPVERATRLVEHVDDVREVTALALNDVNLAPDHFLRWHEPDGLIAERHFRAPRQPRIVDFAPVIRELPDHIDDDAIV